MRKKRIAYFALCAMSLAFAQLRAQDIPDFMQAGVSAAEKAAVASARDLTVSAGFISNKREANQNLTDFFAKRVMMGLPYKTTRAAPTRWNEVAKNAEAGKHVNIMQLSFGKREELFAIMPDGSGDGVKLIARATCRTDITDNYYYHHTAPPGDLQIPDNVRPDLVIQFNDVFERELAKPRKITKLQLIVGDETIEIGEKLPAANPGSFEETRILMTAALFADGYGATVGKQELALVMTIKNDGLWLSVSGGLYRDGKLVFKATHDRVVRERLYDETRLMIAHLTSWREGVSEIADMGQRGRAPVWCGAHDTPDEIGLNKRESLAVFKVEGLGFTGVNAATGEEIWTTLERRKQVGTEAIGGILFERHGYSALYTVDPFRGKLKNPTDEERAMFFEKVGGKNFKLPCAAEEVVGEPFVTNGMAVVASGENKIYLLDIASGAVKKSAETPTWIVAFTGFGKTFFTADLKNQIIEWDATTLEQRRVMKFPFAFLPTVTNVTGFGLRPLATDISADINAAAALWTDEKGICYLTPYEK